MYFGVHCSVRTGFQAALGEALALGCDAMQIFPYRRHALPTAEELDRFREARSWSPVRRLLVHSRYLPALGFPEAARRKASAALLARELRLSAGLGADAFVFHAGAYAPGSSLEEGLSLVAASVREALEGFHAPLALLVENVAGGGRRMGGTPSEIEALLAALRRLWPKVGLCFDTAHAWSAGEDLRTPDGARKALEAYGLGFVLALHLNDTTAERGSRKENHCTWGTGHLGTQGLKAVLGAEGLSEAVAILETPKGEDRKNLELAREMALRGSR